MPWRRFALGTASTPIPTFAIPACRGYRVAMQPLTDPVVPVDLLQMVSRGRQLPPSAAGFTEFLRSHIAEWGEL